MKTLKETKVVIVTGSSRGIGAAVAKRLATEGYALVINYMNNADAAKRVVDEIEAKKGRAVAVQADISVPDQAQTLFDQAIRHFGGVDILVNNAGIMQPGLVSLADTEDALFDKIIAINVKGTFNMLRIAAGKLRAGGRIVNFSSSVCKLALPGYSVYAASKSAVDTLTNVFAKELRGKKYHSERCRTRTDDDRSFLKKQNR